MASLLDELWMVVVSYMNPLTNTVFYFVSKKCREVCDKKRLLKKKEVCSAATGIGSIELLKWLKEGDVCLINGHPRLLPKVVI
jgi:hypothetical protein